MFCFLKQEIWLHGTHSIAGETFRQWMKDIHQNNLFIKNRMKIGREIIDITKIKIPLLKVIAEEDNIVSLQCMNWAQCTDYYISKVVRS
jgi:polyhydroxyalkanoate synthase